MSVRTSRSVVAPRKNVVLALQCSTFSSLSTEAAFRRLLRGDWLQHAATSFSISAVCLDACRIL